MRIGILTLPLHTNYGGILQAYALQEVLRRMGHETVLLDSSPYRQIHWIKFPFSIIKRTIKKYIKGERILVFYEHFHNRTYPIVSQYTSMFINRYISRIEADAKKLKEHDYDAIIVGSDQIWRPQYSPKSFLDFAYNWQIVRIAYAASFGTDAWEYTKKQTKRCRILVKRFHKISVRESSGVKLCQEHLGVEAVHVLDPTMLLTKEDYVRLIDKSSIPTVSCQNTLLCYILDMTTEKKALIDIVAEKEKLRPYYVNSRIDDLYAPLQERIQHPVEQWLRGFHEADFIVTDSFHACVFSILFNKPFIVYGNKARGMERFISLLKSFQLEDRLICSLQDISERLSQPILWERVNAKLSVLRELSMEFLTQALQDKYGK